MRRPHWLERLHRGGTFRQEEQGLKACGMDVRPSVNLEHRRSAGTGHQREVRREGVGLGRKFVIQVGPCCVRGEAESANGLRRWETKTAKCFS